MHPVRFVAFCVGSLPAMVLLAADARDGAAASPQFDRHVVAVFSRAGCNAGTCHGAVQGKNGFRLSLFGANPQLDYEQIVRGENGRRLNRIDPDQSLLLLKGSMQVGHAGGRAVRVGSPEYEVLRRWIDGGAERGTPDTGQLVSLDVEPREIRLQVRDAASLKVTARFADGTSEDVTRLSTFESRDGVVASVDAAGRVRANDVGEAAIIVRYRSEPVLAMVLVTNRAVAATSDKPPRPNHFVDAHVLEKLTQLNVPSSGLADDATFLRRMRVDVTGKLPTPSEVREFLADVASDKRQRKIEQLLADPGHAAVWTLKFCDLLRASDYGIYADGLFEHYEAPRFQAWIRARLEENTPYDEFVERILTATSRDGRSLDAWADEVVALQAGYSTPRTDLELYAKRRSLDIYWQRRGAVGVSGALQAAHAFLGLRLECAQCHRHPHDVWQQDDLLSFANFFMRVRTVGFQGDNEKRYPEDAAVFKRFSEDGKKLNEQVKQLKEGKGKEFAEKARKADPERNRLMGEARQHEERATQAETQAKQRIEQAAAVATTNPAESDRWKADAAKLDVEAKTQREMAATKRAQAAPLQQVIAENDALQAEIREMERRGRYLSDDVPKRVLHAQIFHRTDADAKKLTASVTSPLGTQSSTELRVLGSRVPIEIGSDEDPRPRLVAWLRQPDNPYFARAIVNRVWAHYFGRGLNDPADDLSPFNPCTHPALLDELCRRFIEAKYDLRWLHRTILTSRTYQQSSLAVAGNETDRANYARFYFRRLPAEVLVDALNQATGTREDPDMKYYHWPEYASTVEYPYTSRNSFVTYILEQFGRPARNSSVQCDCERQGDASMLQVLSLANHPRVWQKIADSKGRVAEVTKSTNDPGERIEELYLSTLGRLPEAEEASNCLTALSAAASPDEGLRTVLWSLLNTREFLLQH